jgi:hypothetical protein
MSEAPSRQKFKDNRVFEEWELSATGEPNSA